MKICLLFFVMLLAVAETNAQSKPITKKGATIENQRGPGNIMTKRTIIYPNPFRARFIVRSVGDIEQIQLFDEKDEEIDIFYYERMAGWLVFVNKAEPGDYVVVITYSDGSEESIPISKL